jgi:NTP pyrophosphatase (non-canonical NTP hydrolase)
MEVVCIKDDAGRESQYLADRFKSIECPTTHPQLVSALVKPGEKIAAEINGSDANLLHMVIGISGEAGELLDAVKKAVIYRKELDRANVIEEIGDIEFYLEGLRQELGVSREECLAANVAKLQKRYGDKYSDSAAQIRADKEQS